MNQDSRAVLLRCLNPNCELEAFPAHELRDRSPGPRGDWQSGDRCCPRCGMSGEAYVAAPGP